MQLIFPICVIAFAAAIGVIIVAGGRRAKANSFMTRAVVRAQERDFEGARKLVLGAVSMNPTYKSVPEVIAFYEVLVAKSTDKVSLEEIRKLSSTLTRLPKTRIESIYTSKLFKIVVIMFWLYWAIVRFVDIYSRN